ncbi:MAG: threonylcarbamoyl-AMP synthase [Acidobacteria bacterium]|nr:MAG: threonylcarbamoyl-AMP synthase [Acidobacteriota bacterium]
MLQGSPRGGATGHGRSRSVRRRRQAVIGEAAEAIHSGLVVGIPTDTVYGIGVDPQEREAVSRLFEIKGRPEHIPVGLLVATVEQAKSIGEIGGAGEELARKHWPGPLTMVVKPRVILSDWVGDTYLRTVGIRVPDHPVAQELLERTGPLAVTSANRSGGKEALSDIEARRIFGEEIAVYLEGRCSGGEASTVVDVTGDRLVVLRKGPVPI